MEKFKMLWTGEYNEYWDEVLAEEFELEKQGRVLMGQTVDYRMGEDELIPYLKGKDIFLDGYDKVTERVIKECPDLKLILSIRDGPEESVDIDACTRHGIPVLFAGGRCIHSVAEHTITFLLLCAKPVLEQINWIRSENRWTKENNGEYRALYGEYTELYNKTLGLVGLGRNAKMLAQITAAMGMKVIAYDPYCPETVARECNAELVGLDDVMSQSDYVVLQARVTPETTGMIGARELGLMKPTACLINTARAKLMDTAALIDALKQGKIRKAALDVYDFQPIGYDNPLYDIPPEKLIMTPHMAGYCVERTYNAYALLKPSYENFLRGSKQITIKNPEVFDSPEFKNRGGKLFGLHKE